MTRSFSKFLAHQLLSRIVADIFWGLRADTLLNVDIDIEHPATGLMSEADEFEKGGIVGLRRDDNEDLKLLFNEPDLDPIATRLIVRAMPALDPTSFDFVLNFPSNVKVYTAPIYEPQFEVDILGFGTSFFTPSVDQVFYVVGEEKSTGLKDVEIDVQLRKDFVPIAGAEMSVKLTVVQAEFMVQTKAFIPYSWTEAEPGIGQLGVFFRVAGGDARSFQKSFSMRGDTFEDASFRVMQTVVVTPYEELYSGTDSSFGRLYETAELSKHYNKDEAVDPSELNLTYGYLPLLTDSVVEGEPPLNTGKFPPYREESRPATHVSQIKIRLGASDGALLLGDLGLPQLLDPDGADIDWEITVKVDATDLLNPQLSIDGWHDSFPAYEVIYQESDWLFEFLHQHSPAVDAHPGPGSLDTTMNINEAGTVQ